MVIFRIQQSAPMEAHFSRDYTFSGQTLPIRGTCVQSRSSKWSHHSTCLSGHSNVQIKSKKWGLPWWSSDATALPMQRAPVWSLVRELLVLPAATKILHAAMKIIDLVKLNKQQKMQMIKKEVKNWHKKNKLLWIKYTSCKIIRIYPGNRASIL